jgi:hypothetical protein
VWKRPGTGFTTDAEYAKQRIKTGCGGKNPPHFMKKLLKWGKNPEKTGEIPLILDRTLDVSDFSL